MQEHCPSRAGFNCKLLALQSSNLYATRLRQQPSLAPAFPLAIPNGRHSDGVQNASLCGQGHYASRVSALAKIRSQRSTAKVFQSRLFPDPAKAYLQHFQKSNQGWRRFNPCSSQLQNLMSIAPKSFPRFDLHPAFSQT